MKGILETFKKSLYNPEFYREISGKSFKDAFRYYVKITAFLAVALTTVFAVTLIPQGVRFLREQAPLLIEEHYPQGLMITIEKGQAHTNVAEPYFVSKENGPSKIFEGSDFENLLVIDTQNGFNKDTFDKYKTFALLTKTELITKDTRNKTTIQDLRGFPDVVVSQETLISLVEKTRGMLAYFIPAGILAVLIALFTGYLIYLVPLLLFALIPFIFAWIKNTPLSYGDAYKMSIYAGVPGLALKTLLNMSGFFFVPAYLSFLVFVLIIILNMKDREQRALF
ncbi:MAG: DUF1189 family protein [Candidatus Yonathbacteria bacterium]|nr:DUF1189 family protein [Candidatus Yonathbacteria bacterium]